MAIRAGFENKYYSTEWTEEELKFYKEAKKAREELLSTIDAGYVLYRAKEVI